MPELGRVDGEAALIAQSSWHTGGIRRVNCSPTGLIVSGPSGVGKSSLQRELVANHGFATLTDVTTRRVGKDDFMTHHVPATEFLASVRGGELCAPVRFGSHWYAWRTSEFAVCCASKDRPYVMIARPAIALFLAAIYRGLVPIWLEAPHAALAQRRRDRDAERDRGRTARKRTEDDDASYRQLFPVHVPSSDRMVTAVLESLEQRRRELAAKGTGRG